MYNHRVLCMSALLAMALNACGSSTVQPPLLARSPQEPQPAPKKLASSECVPMQFEQCTFDRCVVYISDGDTFSIVSDNGQSYKAEPNYTPAGIAVVMFNPDTNSLVAFDTRSVCGGLTFPGGETISFEQIETAKPGTFVLSNGWGRRNLMGTFTGNPQE